MERLVFEGIASGQDIKGDGAGVRVKEVREQELVEKVEGKEVTEELAEEVEVKEVVKELAEEVEVEEVVEELAEEVEVK